MAGLNPENILPGDSKTRNAKKKELEQKELEKMGDNKEKKVPKDGEKQAAAAEKNAEAKPKKFCKYERRIKALMPTLDRDVASVSGTDFKFAPDADKTPKTNLVECKGAAKIFRLKLDRLIKTSTEIERQLSRWVEAIYDRPKSRASNASDDKSSQFLRRMTVEKNPLSFRAKAAVKPSKRLTIFF